MGLFMMVATNKYNNDDLIVKSKKFDWVAASERKHYKKLKKLLEEYHVSMPGKPNIYTHGFK